MFVGCTIRMERFLISCLIIVEFTHKKAYVFMVMFVENVVVFAKKKIAVKLLEVKVAEIEILFNLSTSLLLF